MNKELNFNSKGIVLPGDQPTDALAMQLQNEFRNVFGKKQTVAKVEVIMNTFKKFQKRSCDF